MDEREIEAVAEVLAWEFGISERPSQRIIDASAKAVAALDRVRVARGDDEGAWPSEPLMCSEHEDRRAIAYTARCRECSREFMAARSPQDEDHARGDDSRCDQYRDLLETWAAWWNGPGRRGYRDPIIPPITVTGDALRCSICAGEDLGGERCMACGRRG